MVRLSDLSNAERDYIMGKDLPTYDSDPWVEGPPLSERRVALITTAGLHRTDSAAFSFVDLSYRVIPGDADLDELTMTHSSVTSPEVIAQSAAGDLDRQARVAVNERGEGALWFADDLNAFKPLQEFLPEDPELKLRESATHAVMDAVAEREVTVGVGSFEIDLVSVREDVLVPVG